MKHNFFVPATNFDTAFVISILVCKLERRCSGKGLTRRAEAWADHELWSSRTIAEVQPSTHIEIKTKSTYSILQNPRAAHHERVRHSVLRRLGLWKNIKDNAGLNQCVPTLTRWRTRSSSVRKTFLRRTSPWCPAARSSLNLMKTVNT